MKTFFDTAYLGHSIRVINKWNDCSLLIDDTVMDTYTAVVARNFTLKGNIANEDVEIAFSLKQGFPRSTLSLAANGQQFAMKKVFI